MCNIITPSSHQNTLYKQSINIIIIKVKAKSEQTLCSSYLFSATINFPSFMF